MDLTVTGGSTQLDSGTNPLDPKRKPAAVTQLGGKVSADVVFGDQARVKGPAPGAPAEPMVLRRLVRGETAMRVSEPRWRELWAHFDGDQWVERSAVDNSLQRVESREGGGKPRWRPRLARNRFTKAISGEVSIVCSRVPVWECDPINADKEKTNAARLGERVLLSLFDKLGLRPAVYQVGLNAAVTGDGYAWPYFNPNLGEITALGKTGEIEIGLLRQDQVLWEPGSKFETSRWYAVRLAKPLDEVKGANGYKGPPDLKADAINATLERRDAGGQAQLVYVYHYLERPSPEHPTGRWLQIANRCHIAESYPYPCTADVPVIHRFPWIPRPHRERSLGVGELAIDIQRSINRIVNQMIAWRNLVLVPQVLAPKGSMAKRLTDRPGDIVEAKPIGGVMPKIREVPEIPASLYKELDQAYADLDYVVGGNASLPPGVESGSAIQGYNERELSFRSMVVANLAAFWSSLGRHLLYLVQQHYTEERLLLANGRFGVDMIRDFLGEQLMGIGGVRVSEASITPRTRAAQEAMIMAYADKAWISPQMAMSAMQGGTVEAILDRFELDIAKAHRNIQALRLMATMEGDGPPMAGPMDQPGVHIEILSDWMKTTDFEQSPPAVQEAAMALLEQFHIMERGAAMDAAAVGSATAENLGAQNAATPQGGKPMPSRPSIANEAAALAA